MGDFLMATLLMAWAYIAEAAAYAIIIGVIFVGALVWTGISSLWKRLLQWYVGRK